MTSSPMEYWGPMIDPQTKGPSTRLKQLLLGIAHYVVGTLVSQSQLQLHGNEAAFGPFKKLTVTRRRSRTSSPATTTS